MCLYTRQAENKKYLPNKKNGGKPPIAKDERVKYVPVKCGNCIECRKQKRNEWKLRLLSDMEYEKMQFITLTFSEKKLSELCIEIETEEANAVATIAVRRFLENWRSKYGKSVKHWLITELGHKGTERIHLHGFIYTDKKIEEIKDIWTYGIMQLGYSMNEKVIGYTVKYITKTDKDHIGFKPKIFPSAGIGKRLREGHKAYYNRYRENETNDHIRLNSGMKMSMPTYIRNTMYTDEEREKLWIEKLDSGIIYVNGFKIKNTGTKESYDEIRKALEYARELSVKGGYGNGDMRKKEYLVKNKKISQ